MPIKTAAAVAAVLALNGCGVGIVSVRAPERLPAEGLPPLTRRVSFDVCLSGTVAATQTGSGSREDRAALIIQALSRAGVQADLVSVPGEPADFTVTLRGAEERYWWSAVLSMCTFSIIPGYLTTRYNVEVDMALRNPGKGGGREHLVYEKGVDYFNWAPIIVHPDYFAFFLGVGGESARSRQITENAETAGFEETIQRLADDLRIRIGGEGPGPPSTAVVGVTCPLPGQVH
jgi:hypothetical protein